MYYSVAEDLLDVKIVPIEPKSEQDSTYSPTGRTMGGRRSKKEDGASRRDPGTEGDGKLMVIETTRNKG